MDFHFPWLFRINLLAVLVATAAYMALGFVWFGKAAFGKRWLALIGKTEEELKASYDPLVFVWTVLYALATALALAWVVSRSNSWTLLWGAKVGLIAGLGIACTTLATDAAYHGRPRQLLLINAGYHLTAMVLMGAILGAWSR